MPLKCLNGDLEVLSFQLTDSSWEMLKKQNQQEKHLRMPCCDSSVILKRSKLGVPFFSHTKRGPCTSAAETPEHLLAKFLTAKAVEEAGWQATTERRGLHVDGSLWIADVYATKNNWTRIFEIQWSRQSDAETVKRNNIYEQAQLRAMWLFRQKEFELPAKFPAFRLVHKPELNNFLVDMNRFESERGQQIDLQHFVRGALKGALKFAPSVDQILPLEIWIAKMDCWKCKRTPYVVSQFHVIADQIFPAHDDISFSFSELSSSPSAEALASELLPPAASLLEHSIGRIEVRYSKTVRSSYLANTCAYCHALFGDFYSYRAYDQKMGFESTLKITKDLIQAISSMKHQIDVWWFDAARR